MSFSFTFLYNSELRIEKMMNIHHVESFSNELKGCG